jgi:adenylate kinase
VKRRIVLLGPPASGKGTQAELIQKHFNIPATSTGAILRKEAKAQTPLGVEAYRIVSKGGLAPDDLVMRVVASWVERAHGSFLFDGFPRTVPQAARFDVFLADQGLPLELAIFLEVSDKTIVERMSTRLTCRDCGKIVSLGRHVQSKNEPCPNCGGMLETRDDDRAEALARRMREFREKSLPVSDFYREKAILAAVDGDRAVDCVFSEISQLIAG